ncbi:MAG: response regulator [Lachnospiraceae bacterium]|nr:response regulator [Lachnospiraceae bacterium]
MYKIMLADDEGIVLDSISFLLKGEYRDEIIIETAKTGRAVIELAEQFRPDIALMDIHMPGINGIEAMREIRRGNENIIFIVVSAYDKFDYAKEALSLGAMEYLNKPVDKTRLLEVIERAMSQIDSQRKKRSQDLMIREKMETVVPILESGFLYNLLMGESFKEDVDGYKDLLGIEEDYGFVLVLIFGDGQEGSHMNNAAGTSVRLQDHQGRIRETIKEFFPAVVGSPMANKIVAIIPQSHMDPDFNERNTLIDKSQQLVERIYSVTGLLCRAGIGSVVSMGDAAGSYNEALDSLTLTKEPVALTQDLPVKVGYEQNYPMETEKKLFDCVEKGDLPRALAEAEVFFDWMAENYSDHVTDIRLKVLEFVLWAEHLAYHKSGRVYRFLSRKDYLPTVLSLEELPAMREWFLEKIADACRNVTLRKQRQTDNVVDKAKQFIDESYASDISLDEVSRIVDISPYYFSKLFKDATGETFIEYLAHLRIEKAKELFQASELTIKEICQPVGYADPNYFSRIFKKNVGVSPTDYKEMGEGNHG